MLLRHRNPFAQHVSADTVTRAGFNGWKAKYTVDIDGELFGIHTGKYALPPVRKEEPSLIERGVIVLESRSNPDIYYVHISGDNELNKAISRHPPNHPFEPTSEQLYRGLPAIKRLEHKVPGRQLDRHINDALDELESEPFPELY